MTTLDAQRSPLEDERFWEGLGPALGDIRRAAGPRDHALPRAFPEDAFTRLREAGALGVNAQPGPSRPPAELELSLVRRVAAADGSVGRIFDGHLNAVERIAVQAPAPLAEAELGAVRDGRLLAGVWGGQPGPGEGPPATLAAVPGGEVVRGVKTFCSGAGGLDRAAVLVRDPDAAAPVLVWLDLRDRRIEIDRSWYRAAGLVASESHRVVFHDVPVVARLGGPGAITVQPWFARDALRTAAGWVGMADTAVDAALSTLAGRDRGSELEALAAGRILTARRTMDLWLAAAAAAIDAADPQLPAISVQTRVAISSACRELLRESALACGSGPFARGDALDRARRDLELFLLQHRLDPMLARLGASMLEQRP